MDFADISIGGDFFLVVAQIIAGQAGRATDLEDGPAALVVHPVGELVGLVALAKGGYLAEVGVGDAERVRRDGARRSRDGAQDMGLAAHGVVHRQGLKVGAVLDVACIVVVLAVCLRLAAVLKDVPVGQAVLGVVGELVFLIGEHVLPAGKVVCSIVSEGVGRHAGGGHGSEQSLRCVVTEGCFLRASRNPGALPAGVHAEQREDVAVQRIGHARQVAVRVVDVGGSVAGRVGHGGQPSHGVVGEAFPVGAAVDFLHQAGVTVEGVVTVGLLVLALDGDRLDAVQVVVRVFHQPHTCLLVTMPEDINKANWPIVNNIPSNLQRPLFLSTFDLTA